MTTAEGSEAEPRSAVTRRKRRRPEEITDRIIEAAEAVFRDHGFAGATTQAIALKADVTEAQIFRYFGSKAGLFREAVFKPLNRHFSEFYDERPSGAARLAGRANSEAYITELHGFLEEHSQLVMALMVARTYSPDSGAEAGDTDSLGAYFERGAAMMSGRIADPRIDPKLMVRVSFAAVLACVMFKDWLFPEGLATDAEIRQATKDFLIEGLSANT